MAYRESTYAKGNFDYYIFAKNLQGDVIAIYNYDVSNDYNKATRINQFIYIFVMNLQTDEYGGEDLWKNCL